MTILFRSGSRLEAFSDGVFAIAITLLVLDIHVPSAHDASTPALLWHALLARWPSYFAFLLSFWTILISWLGHHLLFQEVKSISRALAWVNGAFLLFVTVIPFTTALVAEHLTHPSGRVAALITPVPTPLTRCCTCYWPASVTPEIPRGITRFASYRSTRGWVWGCVCWVLRWLTSVRCGRWFW